MKSNGLGLTLVPLIVVALLSSNVCMQQYYSEVVVGTGNVGNTDYVNPLQGQLSSPHGLWEDTEGNLFIADWANSRVRKVLSDFSLITTVAGTGYSTYITDDVDARSANIDPINVWIDIKNFLYIADFNNNRIRMVDASGIISTVAGTISTGYSATHDNGPATSASLYGPFHVMGDTIGTLYIADLYNNRIRRVSSAGIITTIAGGGTGYYDNVAANRTSIFVPRSVWVTSSGVVYYTDMTNHNIRKIGLNGNVTTVVGSNSSGYNHDNIIATLSKLWNPWGFRVDAIDGTILIADYSNNRIRAVDGYSNIITTIAGTGMIALDLSSGPATTTNIFNPLSLTGQLSTRNSS
jgi:trimeric autotransporter adhesin